MISGYHKTQLGFEASSKAGLKTNNGFSKLTAIRFGTTNAPETFKSYMKSLFSDCVGDLMMGTLGDFIVYIKTLKQLSFICKKYYGDIESKSSMSR